MKPASVTASWLLLMLSGQSCVSGSSATNSTEDLIYLPPVQPPPPYSSDGDVERCGSQIFVQEAYLRRLLAARVDERSKSKAISVTSREGEVIGYEVSRLRDTSLLRKISVFNSDLIVTMDDSSPSHWPAGDNPVIDEILDRLAANRGVTIGLMRDGTPRRLFVRITEPLPPGTSETSEHCSKTDPHRDP
jgi:hypothetical protein